MRYVKFDIEPKYKSFIECFFIWEGNAKSELSIESPPSAYGSIIFNLGDPYYVSTCKYARKPVPETFIMGQAIRNYTLHVSGKVKMIGIVFRPAGLFHFLGLPMFEFTEERIDLEQVIPEVKGTKSKLSQSDGDKEKVEILSDFINELSENGTHSLPQIVEASNKIHDKNGIININDMLEAVYMSRRCFERHFLEHVGVSPKAYAKLRRFGYTCSLLAGKRKVNLTEILYDCGYYDQSHFIKDFKYFAGRTPKFYVENNLELAHLIQKHELIS